jgi:2-alkenal reductase
MSEPTKKTGQQPNKEQDDALILTPISIARARHASAHKPSVIDDVAKPSSAKSQQPAKISQPSPGTFENGGKSLTVSPHSCLFFAFIFIALIVGGVIGGLMGGGLMLWANGSGSLAFAENTPTPTPTASSTPLPVETATPTPTPLPAATLSTEDIIAHVIPSVVTVINQNQSDFTQGALLDEGRVVGSGVIVDARGYIATNNHVVDTPRNLSVVLADGRKVPAELVAANPADDLAILKIGLTDLPTVEWGDSNKVRPGQTVYAIGSPLGDFPNSVSFGIVSGLNRALEIDKYVIDGLIQTDAAINRGSSGGPLIDTQGKVVGINTFIIRESEERGIAEGIAFAIPAEAAKNLLIPWIAAHSGESVPIPVSGESQ